MFMTTVCFYSAINFLDEGIEILGRGEIKNIIITMVN